MAQQQTFSAQLLEEAADLWPALTDHPFVREVAAGTLDPGRFDKWVQQDHYFVVETRRLWSYAAARSPSEEIGRQLRQAAQALDGELQLFRDHAGERGIDLEALPLPICEGYASFALKTAAFSDFFESFAVIFGAEKAYFDAWSAVRDRTPPDSTYSRWIANWTSPAFAEFVRWIEQTLNTLAERQPPEALQRARQAFQMTARFELAFWDAVYFDRADRD